MLGGDVGDNLDVNLQAAPPGLISAFGQSNMDMGAWETDPSSVHPEPFHLPGDRDASADSENYHYAQEVDAHDTEREETGMLGGGGLWVVLKIGAGFIFVLNSDLNDLFGA
ncbi:unnamed protein product [Dibothriocephalus latus]|uniref:Uncharacterized protein n=1 Tax=Dibothriocephalus latus TaxID=60516 RepID=A0A3P7NZI3_DIBLA|nr:unnamed protein product [Dibothriocephalus latus]